MKPYGPLAPVYDRFTDDIPYEDFADFYEKIFSAHGKQVKTLLDIGCGTGTLTAALAKRGYELVAADASPDMLSIAREKSAKLAGIIQPLFLCQAMTELDLYGTVDAAVSCLDTVNYLPPEELPELFRRLRLFIEPDGILIFDINSPERLRALDGFTSVDEDENSLCLWRADFDEAAAALCYGIDIFTRRGKFWQRAFEEHIEYCHTPEALSVLLGTAGFTGVEIHTDGPQGALGRLFIIAENTPH
ncbi:MAG: class I SAM-dependent methyltransferase [Oscillospiraceae bacterium]|jgi:SAM-dependent methyltransferase|nr:class I SAM-dependent methyltransferase [Oscillospiraceae bacterium]